MLIYIADCCAQTILNVSFVKCSISFTNCFISRLNRPLRVSTLLKRTFKNPQTCAACSCVHVLTAFVANKQNKTIVSSTCNVLVCLLLTNGYMRLQTIVNYSLKMASGSLKILIGNHRLCKAFTSTTWC